MTKKRILGCLRVPPGVRVPQVEYHWSKASVCGCLVAGVAGSNPARAWMFVCCVYILFCPVQVDVSATS
jgi:hypothetical protein